MKIAWFKREINPELGTGVAGYDFTSKSTVIHDNLYMTGLCLDDGNAKALIVSLDLLALDGWYVRNLREECAKLLNTRPELILFSCTHNHSGPEAATPLAPNHDKLNEAYTAKLKAAILEETAKLCDFKECSVTFYSSKCDENRNRRYVTADNAATFTPHRREMIPLANEFADKELGELCFFDAQSGLPLYVIGNYAAHPLAGHTPGLGMTRITADFPGFFRNYITSETGAQAMYISGACGDLVPKEDELGMDAAQGMGVRLAKAAIGGIIDSRRNRNRFTLNEPKLGGDVRTFTVPIRRRYLEKVPPEYKGKKDVTLEIQTLAIGDICFVGMPGEVCCELGMEIKWHSPFRKAFIAYYSTSDFSYMAPANFLVSGGYEGSTQQFGSMGGFELVKTAIDSMFSLHQELFPVPENEEPYPDNQNQPLVDIPQN